MNKRIRELAEQAGIELPDSSVYNGHIYRNSIERFSQLIVAECMEVFSKDLPEEGDGKMLEVINRVCNVAEHFGVD